MLDDAVAVGRIGKLEAKNLRIFLGLLQPVPGCTVGSLGLHDRDREIPAIAQQVISAFLRTADRPVAHEHNPAVGEALLLADLRVFPTGAIKLRENIRAASIGFV